MPKLAPVQHPLQTLVLSLGITQSGFSGKVEAHAGKSLGPTSFSLIVRQGIWPKLSSISFIKESMRGVLAAHGASPEKIDEALDALLLPEQINRSSTFLSSATCQLLEDSMILRRQTLNSDAARHFNLFRSPFIDEISRAEDIFESNDIRYVRESMWSAVTHGDLMAVVGESGSGKTTLVKDIKDRTRRERHALGGEVLIFCPPVIAMDKDSSKGHPLKALDIASCIIQRVAPQESIKNSSRARFDQLHQVLTNSYRSGNRHLLLIEEAHDLPLATLKQLKRLHEMEDGFSKLLGILLVGQPELKIRLTTNVFDIREVVQRIGIVELPALDRDLEGYLTHKLRVAGKKLEDVFTADGIEAMRDSLMINSGRRDRKEMISMVYPLAINNLATAAMNMASELGKSRVTADIVKEL